MKNNHDSPRELLATIQRYRVEYGLNYRDAWALWFDRSGLTGFSYPAPPPARQAGRFTDRPALAALAAFLAALFGRVRGFGRPASKSQPAASQRRQAA